MDFRYNNEISIDPEKENLTFQALEWIDTNEINEEYESESESESDSGIDADSEFYTIRVFGVTKNGESVCLTIKGMECYFFIKVPDNYNSSDKESIIKYLIFRLSDKFPGCINKNLCKYVYKKDFYGFHYDKQNKKEKLFKFLRLSFNNSNAMKRASGIFSNRVCIKSISPKEIRYPCYESNVDTMIRFIHRQSLKTSGWIELSAGCYESSCYSTTQIDITANYKDIHQPKDSDTIGTAPFLQASFDIEAYSQFTLERKVSVKKDSTIVKGHKTSFLSELVVGVDLTLGEEPNFETRRVVKINSDTELEVDSPFKDSYSKTLVVLNKDQPAEEGMNNKRPFPIPTVTGNYVTQIGTSFKRFTDEDFCMKHIITLKECAPIKKENTIVECYNTEKEVLLAWVRLFVKTDPDIIYSYNGDKFDWWYLYERAKLLGISEQFEMGFSRLQEYPCEMKKEKFSSGAYGTSFYNRFKIPGRINFDILIHIQRELKLSSYKLDFVAEKYLKENKHEVGPQEIFEFYRQGTPELIRTVAEYCIQDTLLPQRLVDKLCMLPNQIEMSNVTYVPIRYLIERGQQIKVFSQIIKETAKKGYLIPHLKVPFWSKYRNYLERDVVTFRPDEDSDSMDFFVKRDCKGQIPMFKSKGKWVLNKKYYDYFNQEKFQGATVLDPIPGAYLDDQICVQDFSSLYPNILRDEGFSFDTYILKDCDGNFIHGDVSELEYNKIKWVNKKGENVEHRFVKKDEQPVLPYILTGLLNERKAVKKLMAKETDPFKKALLNAKQLAIKVSCNSVYGFLAANMLKCTPIAECVTTVGRQMIEKTKNFAENYFKDYAMKNGLVEGKLDVEVVYGDSVTGDTPLILLENNEILNIKRIDDVASDKEFIEYPGFKVNDNDLKEKERVDMKDIKIWTDVGFRSIKRVIRHKTTKRMYRIITHTGAIDVTEDHSLIKENKEPVKPKELEIGSKLLHTFPSTFVENKIKVDYNFKKYVKSKETKSEIEITCTKCNVLKSIDCFSKSKSAKNNHFRLKVCKECQSIEYYNSKKSSDRKKSKNTYESYYVDKEEAFVWGFFYAEGSCGMYETKWGVKYSWAINNLDLDLLERCKVFLESSDPKNKFVILDTVKSSNVYKLVVKGDLSYYTNKYRSLFYDKEGNKKVPVQILNSSFDIRKSFFDGYYQGDGSLTSKTKNWCNKGKIGSQGLYYIATSIGMDVSMNEFFGKPNIYTFSERISKNKNIRRVDDNEIKKIIDLGVVNDFVYDIETDIGRFHAGVGKICCFNTDSVFVKFKTEKRGLDARKESMKLGQVCADMATEKLFKEYTVLEYEKIFDPLLLFGKKRYIGALYEFNPEKPEYIDTKGVELKRRDNAQIVKDIYGAAIEKVIYEQIRDFDIIINFIKDEISKLMKGKVDISKLEISKSLRADYKIRTSGPVIQKNTLKNYIEQEENSDSESDEEKPVPNIAHVKLANKMKKRDPGTAPVSGERMNIVFVEDPKFPTNKKKWTPVSDRCEDPKFVKENNLKIDKLYYLNNQLRNPLCQFLGLFVDQPEKIFDEIEQEYIKARTGQKNITNFFKKMS